MRQTDVASKTIADADARGTGQVGRVEGNGDTVEAETHFIDESRAEDVGLAQCADLAMRVAVVAPARNGVALQRGFRPYVLLESIEPVQRIVGTQLCGAVASKLVDLNGPGRKCHIVVAIVW